MKFFVLVLFVFLTACETFPKTGIAPAPIALSTGLASSTHTPLKTDTSNRCISLKERAGLPGSDAIKQTHIIYLADAQDKANQVITQLWMISLADGSEKLLLENVPERKIGFLPDRFHFLLVGPYIWESDLNGSAPQKVFASDVENLLPRYSSLWNQVSQDPEARESQSGVNGLFLYSPDGQHLAQWKYNTNSASVDHSYPLLIWSKETKQNVEVFSTGQGESLLGNWAPDGHHFVFTWYKNIPKYYSVIYSVNVDSSELIPLSNPIDHVILGRPHWAPDGKKVAVPVLVGNRGLEILIVDLSTNATKRFKISPVIRMNDLNEQDDMRWSPDSRWFAYISQAGHRGIELINVENGEIYCGDNHDSMAGIYQIDWQ